jgi:predicted kinase
MPTLTLLRGLPGSGKSTWAKEQVAKDPTKTVRVNKDDLRAMLHAGVWKGDKTERLVLAVRDDIVHEALAGGIDVIVDDTNLEPKHEQELREIASDYKAKFIVNESFLDVPLKDCIKNDLKRPNSVGHKVINKMHIKYLSEKWKPPIIDPTLPHAIIVDIDGTLAHMASRSPYDYTQVGSDVADPTIRLLVHDAWERGDNVIIVTGRDDACKQETIDWLNEHISFTQLHMRVTDDKRDDGIVKHEIYEREIAPFFNVRYVLDDRDRVVEMWRATGLKCLQVGEGDF